MLAAGHVSEETTMRYMRDGESILAINNLYHEPRQKLGKWKQCHCAGDENAARMAAPGSQWQKPLPILVKGFMEVLVGVCSDDPRCHSTKFLCKKCCLRGSLAQPLPISKRIP